MIEEVRQRILARLDTNNDGVVDEQEFLAGGGTKEEFAVLDVQKDGVLDVNELGLYAAQLHTATLDTNNDGVVDEQEFVAGGGTKEEFAALDVQKDGVLDADELACRKCKKDGGMQEQS